MAQITITSDGDYVLTEAGLNIRSTEATTVMIRENTDAATIEFGYGDIGNNFIAFEDGVILTEDIIFHGKGCKLMTRVTGITTGTVNIHYYAS